MNLKCLISFTTNTTHITISKLGFCSLPIPIWASVRDAAPFFNRYFMVVLSIATFVAKISFDLTHADKNFEGGLAVFTIRVYGVYFGFIGTLSGAKESLKLSGFSFYNHILSEISQLSAIVTWYILAHALATRLIFVDALSAIKALTRLIAVRVIVPLNFTWYTPKFFAAISASTFDFHLGSPKRKPLWTGGVVI